MEPEQGQEEVSEYRSAGCNGGLAWERFQAGGGRRIPEKNNTSRFKEGPYPCLSGSGFQKSHSGGLTRA